MIALTIITALLCVAVAVLVYFVVKLTKRPSGSSVDEGLLPDLTKELLPALSDELTNRTNSTAKVLVDSVGMAITTGNTATNQSVASLRADVSNRIDALQTAVRGELGDIRRENTEQLAQMRLLVDQKLTETLDTRLTATFKQVNDQLDNVAKGVGEMRSLAGGVSDLKRILNNVKTRGTWGEISLGALLEQLLAPSQFAHNVKPNKRSDKIVEYAVVLPGKTDNDVVYLPIDSKFPIEDYLRLQNAADRGEPLEVESARKQLIAEVQRQAASIAEKYIQPPHTTDFAIMFLATEGLFAEVLSADGVCESIQRKSRVVIAGPTTLSALLNSLQIGFKTLAIEKQSAEVSKLLGTFKTQFVIFSREIEKTQRKLQDTAKQFETVADRTRIIQKRLTRAETLQHDVGAFAEDSSELLDSSDVILDEVFKGDDE